ncbi:NUDIX hydrolase [Caldivirga maquilingensis]|uniref:NUDIX hydrolase n=1 Tax=Caldivirga maquilingensis (strain ATCC 700844 / DSM 13496 / JCM 10307 / IC-167) TaxID=397948 RepID=A8M9D6_CALMQ|nr:NUDIX hydrolase [Caldivirga maquilingensis]ABW02355.1 NUDIX hydrolase [Caldivirga maquilingensis IC-167]
MSREYPKYPLVGVGAVVINNGKILLVKRANEPGKGKLSIPGGMVNAGEDPGDAAVRELEEETGLRGVVNLLLGVYQYVEHDDKGNVKYHFILLDYLINVKGGSLKASSDAAEALFIDLNEALNMNLTETTRELINDILSKGINPCVGSMSIIKR